MAKAKAKVERKEGEIIKVKFLRVWNTKTASHAIGSVAELPADTAQSLIDEDAAEEIAPAEEPKKDSAE